MGNYRSQDISKLVILASKLSKVLCRGVFKAQSKIYVGTFL